MKAYLVFDMEYGIGPFPRCICKKESIARAYIKKEYKREVEDLEDVSIQEWEITESLDKLFDQCKLIGFKKDET